MRQHAGMRRLAGKIPVRDPRVTINQLDLAAHFNVLLDEHWFGPEGNDLASLPRGLKKLGDVEFELRGLVHLASPEIRSGPSGEFLQGVNGLGAGLKYARPPPPPLPRRVALVNFLSEEGETPVEPHLLPAEHADAADRRNCAAPASSDRSSMFIVRTSLSFNSPRGAACSIDPSADLRDAA